MTQGAITEFLGKHKDKYCSAQEIGEAINVGINSVRQGLVRLLRWGLVEYNEVPSSYVNTRGVLIKGRVRRLWKLKEKLQ